jgi:hypothetical protein
MAFESRLGICAVLGFSLVGCRYDIDKIYAHSDPNADAGGQARDAGADAASAEPPPAQLIELWRDQAFSTVDDDCASCAKRGCAKANEACRNDPACVAFTRCVAESTDPQTQNSCRASHVAWLSEDVEGRDVGGPYQQCVFQDQCAEQCSARTNWQCVDEFSWPMTSEKSVPFRFRFNDALNSQKEVAGMQIKVCRPDDLYCKSPIGMGKTDKNGEVQLQLGIALRTFQGYFELTGANVYPSLLRFGWPLVQEGVTNVTVIDEDSFGLNTALLGIEPDPERGILQLRAFSCNGVGAKGVAFETSGVDDKSFYWYASKDGIPDLEAAVTEKLGAGGVINVFEGRQNVLARNAADNKVVSKTPVPVRKGFMTIVVMAPLGVEE